jgi:hypothetical protein
MQETKVLRGFCIVVLDRGFVYVGNVVHDGEWCVISNARNIRYWGTKSGLGELAQKGPQEKTILDFVGTVRAPDRSVISLIDTEEKAWTSK